MRIAAIDVGSNSIHLVVVEADAVGNQRVLAREKAMVRLARGTATSGEISPEAFQTGLETLALMGEIVRGFHCETVLACGTAALREARNAPRFLAEAARLGVPIRVISGEEEARLIFQAVSHAIPFPEEPVALLDIGGGSTEITWVQGGRAQASLSLPWGVQRLADKVATANPPAPADLQRAERFFRKVLRKARKRLPKELPAPKLVLGTAGTLLDLSKACGAEGSFTRIQLKRFQRRLWRGDAQFRMEKLGVEPKRAEVLHVGASWAGALLRWLGAEQVRVLPVGVREGMIWEALRHGGSYIPPLADRRRASVEALAERLDPDPGHSLQVQRLCEQLFDAVQPQFELGEPEREWLSLAARLHDIGFSVSEKAHHKHGAYLIRNGGLQGFWPQEAEILAQVVRHHRGKDPSPKRHQEFRLLAPWHRQVVVKLAAILRAADALDRRRRQVVRRVELRDEGEYFTLSVEGLGDLRAELEALQDKGDLLFRLLDRPVEIRAGMA
ncbi:MAG: Ppx/GppA family phosphatase [Acidobacteria bacterium]|nr:Ppx/GppA family phosphatase [Acidobacteriota bacterium]